MVDSSWVVVRLALVVVGSSGSRVVDSSWVVVRLALVVVGSSGSRVVDSSWVVVVGSSGSRVVDSSWVVVRLTLVVVGSSGSWVVDSALSCMAVREMRQKNSAVWMGAISGFLGREMGTCQDSGHNISVR